MTIQIGDPLPDVTLTTMTADGPEPIGKEFFSGKTVALFAVPGAFTPTCSARHLPGFITQAAALKAKGVDVIACTAVNDIFVLAAWGKANDADDIMMLADGRALFAEALGLAADGAKYGMGTRSRRYSMLIEDGIVKLLYIENPGEFEVSSADYLLEHI